MPRKRNVKARPPTCPPADVHYFENKRFPFENLAPRLLNSAEHEILNTRKYENIKKFMFLGSDKPVMLFSLLGNVEMPIRHFF